MFQLPHSRGVGRSVVLACAIVAAAGTSAWSQTSRTYTTTADFQEGLPFNVNATVVPDQLQLNVAGDPLPFPVVNIAASGRGTLVRIDGATGQVVAEYATSPDGLARNPSRTATDAFGNVWVGNRNEDSMVGRFAKGSVVKIGLCVGGTRVAFPVCAPSILARRIGVHAHIDMHEQRPLPVVAHCRAAYDPQLVGASQAQQRQSAHKACIEQPCGDILGARRRKHEARIEPIDRVFGERD
jgi:hypothetical protein